MTVSTTTEHQDNYMDIDEARVAATTARSRDFASEISARTIIREHNRFPESAFPFSGDHLGVFSHREATPQGDPGDEVRRERILNSDIDLWALVSA